MEEEKDSAVAASGEENEPGLAGEFLAMLKENKKYWLVPLIAVAVLLVALIILGSTAVAPFIYTLF